MRNKKATHYLSVRSSKTGKTVYSCSLIFDDEKRLIKKLERVL